MWLLPYSTVHAVYITEYMTYCTHAQYKALQLLKADIAIGVLMNKYGLCIVYGNYSIKMLVNYFPIRLHMFGLYSNLGSEVNIFNLE